MSASMTECRCISDRVVYASPGTDAPNTSANAESFRDSQLPVHLGDLGLDPLSLRLEPTDVDQVGVIVGLGLREPRA